MPSQIVSQAALAAGLPARFLYWCGRSMRRYLFTALEPRGLADFEDGVAIAVEDGRVIWSGEIAALGAMPDEALPRRAELFVHLLARTPDERRGVIEDFRPRPGGGGDGLKLAA